MSELAGWSNFYVIAGSSAGALIGLQFVVMTLIADIPSAGSDELALNAFGTPIVFHFSVVLLLSAIINAPWHSAFTAAICCGAAGFVGMLYAVVVAWRVHKQSAYEPELEDRIFYVLLPMVAYAVLTASAFVAAAHLRQALFVVAGSALALLFIAIRNTWDTVTYHVLVQRRKRRERLAGK